MKERLQKILARAGFGSRRACEGLIANGCVTINGEVETRMGVTVDPAEVSIKCGGVPVRSETKVHYLVNKPLGYVCTSAEDQANRRAIDLVHDASHRLYTVGRLDADTEGLVIVTNDGELTNLLTHPRYGVAKTYLVELDRELSEEARQKLLRGVHLSDGRVKIKDVRFRRRDRSRSAVEITIVESMDRAIRRALAKLGYGVRKLRRTCIGSLSDRRLKAGQARRLTRNEVEDLKALARRRTKQGDAQ